MNKVKNILTTPIEKIILFFLFLQPFIDVLTAVSLVMFHHSFLLGLGIRMLFLLFMLYYIIVHHSKNRKYVIAILLYMVLFMANISCEKGIYSFSYELKSLMKSFYFPIVLLGFYEVYQNHNSVSSNNLKKIFIIYLLLVFLPNILGIGFPSYEVTKSGRIGFFYTANEIGAILAILMPIFFYHLFQKENKIINVLSIIIVFYLYLSIGTKAPLMLFVILLIYYFGCYFTSLVQSKKYKSISIIGALLILFGSAIVLLLPKTNFYQNIKVHLEYLEIEKPSDIFKDTKTLDHFIFSERLRFWSNTSKIYKKSSMVDKVIGIGYINNYSTDQVSMKMVEMDFIDLFYRHGILGFLLYLLPVVILFYQILVKYRIERKKEKMNPKKVAYLFSLGFAILLSLITGHVILSPSVSIYVALILILLYNELYKESKL